MVFAVASFSAVVHTSGDVFPCRSQEDNDPSVMSQLVKICVNLNLSEREAYSG